MKKRPRIEEDIECIILDDDCESISNNLPNELSEQDDKLRSDQLKGTGELDELNEESRSLLDHLNVSADKLDGVVRSITRVIEKSDG